MQGLILCKEGNIMFKKLLLCAVLVAAMVSAANAETYFWSRHLSVAGLTDGHADYSSARFHDIGIEITDSNAVPTAEDAALTGTLTLSGGSYSFWDEGKLQQVSGTQHTFNLAFAPDGVVGSGIVDYPPVNDAGNFLRFMSAADGGLNGVTGSAVFPGRPDYNVQGSFPRFRTTQEQLNTFVPYVEYIRSGSQVTGLVWRVVNPADTSRAVSQDFEMRFRVRAVYGDEYEHLYNGSNMTIPAGENPEGVVTFDEPIDESEIWAVRIRLRTYETGSSSDYDWVFFSVRNEEPYLWSNHLSEASLINGRSSYESAEFYGIHIDVERENMLLEAKHLSDSGRITISGGGYTVREDEPDEIRNIRTVASGQDTSFVLEMNKNTEVDIGGASRAHYYPFDGGKRFVLAGGAEKGLNGKAVSWTFPDAPELNGSAVMPNFKSMNEQLAQGVPYIELVSADGNITAINYRIVTVSNTSAAIEPSYSTDFRFFIDYKDYSTYQTSWQRDTAYGRCVLDEAVPIENLRRIRVRFRTREDSNNPAVYQWNFYPASAPQQSSSGSSSSGCTTGFTFAALFLAASLFLARKH